MLFLQVSFSQKKFIKTTEWLKNDVRSMGGRAVLVILKDGKIVYNDSENNLSDIQKAGLRYIAKRRGKDRDEAVKDFTFTTREPIASCSKWLSAALVMTFVDEGKLSLDDTIGKFLPVLSKHQKGNITIKDCLAHLTGIDGGGLKESRQLISESRSMDEVINKIAVLPMEGKPGQVFHYSSIGLQIAAAVIEKISGKDFKTLFNERIAAPCGMANTDFGEGKIPLAAGGAISTPEDYIHFLQMILQEGYFNGKQILSRESIIKMEQDDTKGTRVAYTPDESGILDYGLGEWILENGNSRADVVSSPGLFGSFPWVNNKKHYAGFLFVLNINQKGRAQKYDQLQKLVNEEIGN
jgi:CubicO group peptidase (beta-lactamase class C family)